MNSNNSIENRWSRLQYTLLEDGYTVEIDENTVVITEAEDGSSVEMIRDCEWIHLASILLESSDLDNAHIDSLMSFVFTLQSRYIGCRFAVDLDGNLAIVADLYPHQQTHDNVVQVIDQLLYVASVALPLFDSIIDSGVIPAEDEVDSAFEV